MIISWLGEAGIRIQSKDTVVIIDPPAASTGFKPTRQAVQIIALTQADGRDAKSLTGEPFMIDSPGEYERQNVFIYGLPIAADPGRVHFRLETEDLSLGHLGNLAVKLDNGQAGAFEEVDILFVPVGGKSVLDAEEAAELVSQIEPRIVIPIQFKIPGHPSAYGSIEAFLKEMGAKSAATIDKLKIVKKDLPAEETKVIVLTV